MTSKKDYLGPTVEKPNKLPVSPPNRFSSYKRKEYEMTDKQLQDLLEACKPIPMIALNCGTPPSGQERANNAWSQLGKELGFDYMTVRPIPGKSEKFFTAEPINE